MNINQQYIDIIRTSRYFNRWYYYLRHPWLLWKTRRSSAAEHYLMIGAKKNYDPSIRFSTKSYLDINQDVKANGINPLVHYELYGQKEQRKIRHEANVINFLYAKASNCSFFPRHSIVMVDAVHHKDVAPIDNFCFFEYLMSHPSKNISVYYILNEKYQFYNEIKKKYGKHIIPFTNTKSPLFIIRFLLLCFKTRYILDSFDIIFTLFGDIFVNSKYIDVIFTQHGVTFFKRHYIRPTVYGQEHMNKVIVSNDFEFDIFRTLGAYNRTNIIKCGLFRWDLLKQTKNTDTKHIFLYFTYRHYLKDTTHIEETNYFKNILAILRSEDLLTIMKENKVVFDIALHHAFWDFLNEDALEKIPFNLVKEEDILKAKNSASLLITDYSSMCFEFMFLNKPVIFYRLDEDEFNNSEKDSKYSKDINTLNKYIFNVFNNYDSVIKKIKYYIKNSFVLESEYNKKLSLFFYTKKHIRSKIHKYIIRNWNIKKHQH